MRSVVLAGWLMCLGCRDKALEPAAYCQEELMAGGMGQDAGCGVRYVPCPEAFACAWVVHCGPANDGTTTCRCMPDPPGTSCNVDGSFQSVDLCGAVSAADRAAVRQAVLKGCFPSQDPAVIDFSRLP